MIIFSFHKCHRSKPIYEDNIIYHIGIESPFCGIDKRHVGIYNQGFDPMENIEKQEIYICKNCFRIWKKYKNENS
jgi:hypothetical protein